MKLFFSEKKPLQNQSSNNKAYNTINTVYSVYVYNCTVVVYTKTKIHGGKH